MKLGDASFTNATGQKIEIYTKVPGKDKAIVTELPSKDTSKALNGTLLNIDVVGHERRYSYDLTKWLPNGLLVKGESPYRITQIADLDKTLILVITDKKGKQVEAFRPTGLS